jgi:hypothetical protein
MGGSDSRKIAEKTRRACLDAAARAYDDAKLRGMCSEGAWDYALDAIRSLNLDQLEDEDPDQTRL